MSLKSEAARSVRPRIVEEIPRSRATDLAVRLAEQVRRLRIQAGLTQAELAARVGCSAAAIRKFEAGQRRPSSQLAERLAAAIELREADRPAFADLLLAAGFPHLAALPQAPDAAGL